MLWQAISNHSYWGWAWSLSMLSKEQQSQIEKEERARQQLATFAIQQQQSRCSRSSCVARIGVLAFADGRALLKCADLSALWIKIRIRESVRLKPDPPE